MNSKCLVTNYIAEWLKEEGYVIDHIFPERGTLSLHNYTVFIDVYPSTELSRWEVDLFSLDLIASKRFGIFRGSCSAETKLSTM